MSDIKHLRAIFEKAPLGIFITSQEGELMDVNERFALFMGFSSGKQMKDSVMRIWQAVMKVKGGNTVEGC